MESKRSFGFKSSAEIPFKPVFADERYVTEDLAKLFVFDHKTKGLRAESHK